MLSSEIIVTLLIWGLTAAGLFFGLRTLWRRKHWPGQTIFSFPTVAKKPRESNI